MFSASADDWGTVQALSRELDLVNEDGESTNPFITNANLNFLPAGIIFALSPRFEKKTMDVTLYYTILRHLAMLFPQLHLRSHIQFQPAANTTPLTPIAHFFDYAIVRQRRFYASRRSPNNHSSLVEVVVSERGETWAGELLDLIHIDQGNGQIFTLAQFRWFKPLQMDLSGTIWNAL